MSAELYIEGGGDRQLNARCREAFTKLLANCGLQGRMPHVVACGSRNSAFKRFRTAHELRNSKGYVALWIDSEDPIADTEKTWEHLTNRDPAWKRPAGAKDEQVLLMTTCMETWFVADREAIKQHFHGTIQESVLPKDRLETRHRQEIQAALVKATKKCSNAYKKGDFGVLAKLNPTTLEALPSFARVRRILNKRLH